MAVGSVVHVDFDHVRAMLENGWQVAGYSTVLMAAGAMTHSILLQKDSELMAVNTTISGGWTGPNFITTFLAFSKERDSR